MQFFNLASLQYLNNSFQIKQHTFCTKVYYGEILGENGLF